jgi:hypothetical protein
MSEKTLPVAARKVFEVVSCGRDEYPGDGLRIVVSGERDQLNKDFLRAMGIEVQDGDEVEISARIISRVVPAHRVRLAVGDE